MLLLVFLAQHVGEVVSIDTLLDQVWADVTVAPDSVYQAVTTLRRVLGDDPRQPSYIATVPRLGYRMIADVSPLTGSPAASSNSPEITPSPHRNSGLKWAAAAVLVGAIVAALLFLGQLGNKTQSAPPVVNATPEKSIAVLPFLDLTDAMSEEPFADGMTEELIDKFSKVPGLRVPSPTSSFYFKGKLWPRSKATEQVTIAEIAKLLNVVYVLDGSVRKSGARLRVDTRLIRAENGFVVWSETYDRPSNDILMVQQDIAEEVTKALKSSIETKPN